MKRPLIALLTVCATICLLAQNPLRVMTWNVENLFDTIHDEGKNDLEFTPEGGRHWSSYRYWRKLRDVARTIIAANEDCVPDIVGLCEVENDSVMRDLCQRTQLREFGYRYVMSASDDPRGIDVAMMYRPARFKLMNVENLRIQPAIPSQTATRDLLHVSGLILVEDSVSAITTDTLHVIVVHLPSQLGGRPAKRLRKQVAEVLWQRVQDIINNTSDGKKPNIVVMGDFNATLSDKLFRDTPLLTTDPAFTIRQRHSTQPTGTYRYRGIWQCIDHLLVSPSFAEAQTARIITLPSLLEKNTSRGGYQPRRTYQGPAYHGGISDHLPLYIELPTTYK